RRTLGRSRRQPGAARAPGATYLPLPSRRAPGALPRRRRRALPRVRPGSAGDGPRPAGEGRAGRGPPRDPRRRDGRGGHVPRQGGDGAAPHHPLHRPAVAPLHAPVAAARGTVTRRPRARSGAAPHFEVTFTLVVHRGVKRMAPSDVEVASVPTATMYDSPA